MSYREPARAATRRIPRIFVAGLLVLIAAAVGALGYEARASSSSATTSSIAPGPLAHPPHDGPRRETGGALSAADGVVPNGVTVFDDEYPAVANLDPALLRALRRAATDAAGNGVEFDVDSGWRSPKYQQQLLTEAIAKYGSKEEAARWVATPDTSAHVSGDAVDIGSTGATAWLSKHGAEYGLCQIYGNEAWHYEMRPEAVDHGCPARYADPTHDPRMHR
jgi:D-alanyl-D-alanine carboxypeptidase